MAFISEINLKGGSAASGGEFVEVALKPGDNPANYVVSVYDGSGYLHTGAGLPTGQVNLSTLTGTPDPNNPAWTIYVINVGIRTKKADANEASGVSLTNVSTGNVIDFYSSATLPPITAQNGAAQGAVSQAVLDQHSLIASQSYQWTPGGTQTTTTDSSGTAVICLSGTTLVRVEKGLVPVWALQAGDRVWTADRGYQVLRWIGSRQLDAADLLEAPNNRPITIEAGALAPGLPTRRLVVSPQHRIMIRSRVAERMYGTAEVLVAAKRLIGWPGISVDETAEGVTYFHLLFDRHELIEAEGALVESLLLAPGSMGLIDTYDRDGSLRALAETGVARLPARALAERRKGKTLIERMRKNGRDLVEPDAPGPKSVQRPGVGSGNRPHREL